MKTIGLLLLFLGMDPSGAPLMQVQGTTRYDTAEECFAAALNNNKETTVEPGNLLLFCTPDISALEQTNETTEKKGISI